MFPAGAGVILRPSLNFFSNSHVPRRRGGDPKVQQTKLNSGKMFPAGAGVIPVSDTPEYMTIYVPRRRGGDPYRYQG